MSSGERTVAQARRRHGTRRVTWTLLLAAVWLLAGCEGVPPAVRNGDPAPVFELQPLGGAQVRFPDDYRGQVVAIRFWADWCPYCRDEMVDIEPVYRKYRDQGLRVLAINVRQSDAVAAAFVQQLGISYAVLLDLEGSVARAYGVLGLPTTFFIDRQGTLRARILGESTAEAFDGIVAELL
jgi:peroxiredoxin